MAETAKTELPKICTKIAEKAKSLGDIVNFYEAYIQFTNGKELNEDSMKCLKYVIGMSTKFRSIYSIRTLNQKYYILFIAKGNTTAAEFLQEDSSQLTSDSDFNITVVDDSNEKQTDDTYDIKIESDDSYADNITCVSSDVELICLQDELTVDFPTPTILEHQTMIDFMNDLLEVRLTTNSIHLSCQVF